MKVRCGQIRCSDAGQRYDVAETAQMRVEQASQETRTIPVSTPAGPPKPTAPELFTAPTDAVALGEIAEIWLTANIPLLVSETAIDNELVISTDPACREADCIVFYKGLLFNPLGGGYFTCSRSS